MTERITGYDKTSEANYKGLLDWYAGVKKSGLDPLLVELLLIRCSPINGCLFCIDLRTKDARKLGETEQRICALNAWREAAFYNEKEKAALDYAESVTLVKDAQVPDEVFMRLESQFSGKEIIDLTMPIPGIDAWNRLGIAFRSQPRA